MQVNEPYYHWYRGKPCGCTDGRHPKLFRAEPAAVVFLFQDRIVAQARRIAELEAALAGHSERLAVLAGEIANQRAVERDLKTENTALRKHLAAALRTDSPETLEADYIGVIERLSAENAALREALAAAKAHCDELYDAWMRGALSEHDGKGGLRSNRNADVLRQLRAALEGRCVEEGR